MKLQKQRSREVKGKEYYRWTTVIPPKKIEELKWKEGTQLESKVKNGTLIIKPKILSRDSPEITDI